MVKALAHEAIYDAVEEILGPLPRGVLLDVPAGEGALATRLAALGFDVRCCDLHPQMFRLPGFEIRRGDLSAALPYEDASFDYVVCVEGLEHIENPHRAAREFGRLVRAGGHLVVSVPNVLNIEERLKQLLYGYTSHFKPLSSESLARLGGEFAGIEEAALHINPIAYPELRYILEQNGFELRRLYRDKPKKNAWAYRPLAGLIRALNRLQPEPRRRERWSAELHSDEVLLGGNTLVVHAVKTQAPRPGGGPAGNVADVWKGGVRRQFGAAIDMLENAVRACPEGLWGGRGRRTEFWYVVYHTLFFLDLYLSGSAEGFAPPEPFTPGELDPSGVMPGRVYTKEELLGYLRHGREKCRAAVGGLTDERARTRCAFNWGEVSYAELLLYNLRHVQHHAGQLNLLLRQGTDAAPGWVCAAGGPDDDFRDGGVS